VVENGARTLYQEGTVAKMRVPAELIRPYTKSDRLPPGTVMFGGTFAVIGGLRPASEFHMEMVDPVRGRKIEHNYRIHTLPIE
jgi:hypothetical protein